MSPGVILSLRREDHGPQRGRHVLERSTGVSSGPGPDLRPAPALDWLSSLLFLVHPGLVAQSGHKGQQEGKVKA